jgi:hypothetical protein
LFAGGRQPGQQGATSYEAEVGTTSQRYAKPISEEPNQEELIYGTALGRTCVEPAVNACACEAVELTVLQAGAGAGGGGERDPSSAAFGGYLARAESSRAGHAAQA